MKSSFAFEKKISLTTKFFIIFKNLLEKIFMRVLLFKRTLIKIKRSKHNPNKDVIQSSNPYNIDLFFMIPVQIIDICSFDAIFCKKNKNILTCNQIRQMTFYVVTIMFLKLFTLKGE